MNRIFKSLTILGACYVVLAPIIFYVEASNFEVETTSLFWSLCATMVFYFAYSMLGFYLYDTLQRRKQTLITTFHLANILIRFVLSLMLVALYYLLLGDVGIVFFIVNLLLIYLVTMVITNILYFKTENRISFRGNEQN